jgi:hypothetical protein
MSVDIYRGAVGGDRHAHEEIDIADDPALPISQQCRLLALPRSSVYRKPAAVSAEDLAIMALIAAVEPKLRQRFDEIAKAAMCAADAVAQEVVGLATASVDRVVPTVSIFQDRKQRVAEIRIQNRAFVDEQFALGLDCVGRAIAVGPILNIVAKEIYRLLAFEVDQPQCALGDAVAPGPPGRHRRIKNDLAGGRLGSVMVPF